jgi:hypothetical protein
MKSLATKDLAYTALLQDLCGRTLLALAWQWGKKTEIIKNGWTCSASELLGIVAYHAGRGDRELGLHYMAEIEKLIDEAWGYELMKREDKTLTGFVGGLAHDVCEVAAYAAALGEYEYARALLSRVRESEKGVLWNELAGGQKSFSIPQHRPRNYFEPDAKDDAFSSVEEEGDEHNYEQNPHPLYTLFCAYLHLKKSDTENAEALISLSESAQQQTMEESIGHVVRKIWLLVHLGKYERATSLVEFLTRVNVRRLDRFAFHFPKAVVTLAEAGAELMQYARPALHELTDTKKMEYRSQLPRFSLPHEMSILQTVIEGLMGYASLLMKKITKKEKPYTDFFSRYEVIKDLGYYQDISEKEFQNELRNTASPDGTLSKHQLKRVFSRLLCDHNKIVNLGLNADSILGELSRALPGISSKIISSHYEYESGVWKEKGEFGGKSFDVVLHSGDELDFIDTFILPGIEKNTDLTLEYIDSNSDSYTYLLIPKGKNKVFAQYRDLL